MERTSLEVRKLTPALINDYLRFFDSTPHDDLIAEHKCYCVPWCSEDGSRDYEERYLSSAEKRREHAAFCIRNNSIQGYLAYCGNEVAGWCNANAKADCRKCYGWRRHMGYVPIEDHGVDRKIKSIFCFAVAPAHKRQGIATRLLERVCKDAAQDGYDFVEAYPKREPPDEALQNGGPFEMYRKSGFVVYLETEQGFIIRKHLK